MVLQDRYLDVENVRVRYWHAGESGTPVLLVHGLGASVEWWAPNVLPLAARHRVFALDLPGFGRSEPLPAELSLPRAAVFLRLFLETLGVSRAHVVANSMGGLIALQFAAQFSRTTRRLVLVSPAGFGRSVHWIFRVLSLPLLGRWLARPNRRAMALFHRHLISGDGDWITDDWLDRVHALSRLPGTPEMLLEVAQMGLNLGGIKPEILKPLHRKLPQVAAPTLLVWGDQDRLVPPKQAQRGRQMLPNARLHVFPGCGHCPQLERAAEFNALALRFLNPHRKPGVNGKDHP
jgi:4,5:9,10-diseco-3-hydroxy-5,9,17-trioxoandrosta-1(10),2-diene-4-oate hydrolase